MQRIWIIAKAEFTATIHVFQSLAWVHIPSHPIKSQFAGFIKHWIFEIVGEINGRSVVFDDTVYFLSFDTGEQARKVLYTLLSQNVQDFYSSMIFWDEKRPIKTSILNRLNLQKPETAHALRLFERKQRISK